MENLESIGSKINLKVFTFTHGNIECHHIINSSPVLDHGVLRLIDDNDIVIDVINYSDLVRIEYIIN